MRLREYAIAICTSAAFGVTLPIPLSGWATKHLEILGKDSREAGVSGDIDLIV
jgi:hypothetical protein